MLLSDKSSDNNQGWDHMFRRNRHENVHGDVTTNKLLDRGVYSIHKPKTGGERGFRWRDNNILSGMWYVFILSCLLWWLIPFGQMIAGYIGGRKAGSPIKGVLVTALPALVILLLLVGMDVGLFPFLGVLTAIPGMIMSGIQSLSPHAGHFFSGIYNSLRPLAGLDGGGFIVIVTFGLIGGILADMNRKEILHATSKTHFYDPFVERFSGASLNKLADMVAERVIWTLSTVNNGGRSLIGKFHHEPTPMGFEELKRLPAASTMLAPNAYPNKAGYETQPYEHEEFGYKALSPEFPPEEEFMRRDNFSSGAAVRDVPVKSPAEWGELEPYENDFGITHRDMTEETMARQWKEHKRNIDIGKNGQSFRRDARNITKRVCRNDHPAHLQIKEKRDALVYDNSGNLMDTDKSQGKGGIKFTKKKQPALVSRALDADKKIKAKESKEALRKEQNTLQDTELPKEQKDEVKFRRVKPEQSYERL